MEVDAAAEKLVADDFVRRLSEVEVVAAVDMELPTRLPSEGTAAEEADAKDEWINSTGLRRGDEAEMLEEGEAARVISAT